MVSSRNRTARRVTRAALVSGGAAVSGFYTVLLGESLLARKAIGTTDARPPRADGLYGDDHAGTPISALVLGDSAAVGYGMTSADATPPAMFGVSLSHVLDRPVEITSVAVVGARTSDLQAQIDVGLEAKPDVAVIVIGTNDVTHQVPVGRSARQLRRAVKHLVDEGCEVVVGTCPDLGTVRPIKQPLRAYARVVSRRLAALQSEAVVEAGGRSVSLGGLLGPVFREQFDVMFGADHFNPSETGYANMVGVLVPSMAAAIRSREVETALTTPSFVESPRDMLPLSEAASHAAQHDGTEVSAEQSSTSAGRWASVRKRLRVG